MRLGSKLLKGHENYIQSKFDDFVTFTHPVSYHDRNSNKSSAH